MADWTWIFENPGLPIPKNVLRDGAKNIHRSNQDHSKMTGTHGGRRVGAGRRRGALTKRTREVAERAAAEGKTPLEIMLENMRHFHKLAVSAEKAISSLSADKIGEMPPDEQFKYLLAEVKRTVGLREMAHTCARDAAPYMHPKLSQISGGGGSADGAPLVQFIIHGVGAPLAPKLVIDATAK